VTPVMRSDNGLIYQSRRVRAACRDYRLRQEFITPYTPEQNGIIERFFRSLKDECVWPHLFPASQRLVERWPRGSTGLGPGAGLSERTRTSGPTRSSGGFISGRALHGDRRLCFPPSKRKAGDIASGDADLAAATALPEGLG